ncbi:MAG TPA: hypothetical protein VKH42_11415 [Vicinamibacterales bacterium]|nr:hypothetical protein [Vicinamibacterales bacterium]
MPEASPNRGVWIVLAYLWAFAFIPLILEREDADVRWHARHGVLLMAAELTLAAAYFALSSMVHFARFGLGGVVLVCVVLTWAAVFALHIAAIVKGLDGRRLIVPGVSALLK